MRWTALLLLLAQTLLADTPAPQQIPWRKAPIAIALGVGEERMLHFRGPVSVGLPATLESVLRTQTVSGTVYLLARAPFGSTRVMVREIEAGQTYLFDLSASTEGGGSQAIVVTLEETAAADNPLAATNHDGSVGYVSLIRFAAQQLYAPVRLLSAMPGIVRVPIQQKSVPLVPDNGVEAMPLAAWRAGTLYVSAIKLTNRLAYSQTLDPRTLRGAWLSAAFQHSRLLPAGSDADTTAVYLVSEQPFHAAL
jgi:integrating conjugative element protein (TIGR03749 family)